MSLMSMEARRVPARRVPEGAYWQPQVVSESGRSGSLYDVLELILDRGLVIDAFIRVSLVGIEVLTIEARVVVASVDTYLRLVEACDRLDLPRSTRSDALPGVARRLTEGGARGRRRRRRALGGVAERIGESFGITEDLEGREGTRDRWGEGRTEEVEPRPPVRKRQRQRSRPDGVDR